VNTVPGPVIEFAQKSYKEKSFITFIPEGQFRSQQAGRLKNETLAIII
jgi:hypothetical protein